MESMGKKPRRRRSFTPEFKAEIVELCQRGDRSVGQVAKDFDLTETAVREWVKQAERDAGTRQDGGLTSDGAAGAGRAAPGEPPAARGRGDPQAGHGFLREGDPVNVYPFIEAEKAQQAQRQAGVRAAEGLPCRLLRRTCAGPPSPRERADAELTAQITGRAQASPRAGTAPRGSTPSCAAEGHRHGRKRVARLMRAGRAGGPGAEAVEEDHHPRPGRRGPGGPDPPGLHRRRRQGQHRAGAATSPTSRPGRAGCTWPPSSTSPPAASSASPWPITCAPSWSPTRWPTRSRPATRRPG